MWISSSTVCTELYRTFADEQVRLDLVIGSMLRTSLGRSWGGGTHPVFNFVLFSIINGIEVKFISKFQLHDELFTLPNPTMYVNLIVIDCNWSNSIDVLCVVLLMQAGLWNCVLSMHFCYNGILHTISCLYLAGLIWHWVWICCLACELCV